MDEIIIAMEDTKGYQVDSILRYMSDATCKINMFLGFEWKQEMKYSETMVWIEGRPQTSTANQKSLK